MIELVADKSADLLNEKRFDVIMGHYPSGVNTMTLKHWVQMVKSAPRKFTKFDYGNPEEN